MAEEEVVFAAIGKGEHSGAGTRADVEKAGRSCRGLLGDGEVVAVGNRVKLVAGEPAEELIAGVIIVSAVPNTVVSGVYRGELEHSRERWDLAH